MKKENKSNLSFLGWLLAYLLIALLLYLSLEYVFSSDLNILDWISVYGLYTTMYSLVLMFVQFKSIRDVSEETKNKLNKTIAISDLSRYSELIRSVEMDVRKGNIDVALYKTQIIKDLVHKILMLENRNGIDVEEYDSVFSILATHVDSYNDQLLSKDSTLNKSVILRELEIVTSFLQNKSNEMINNFE